LFEGRRVGRIREATERFGFNPGWTWAINPPLPIPTWGTSQASTLDDADAARSWTLAPPPGRRGRAQSATTLESIEFIST